MVGNPVLAMYDFSAKQSYIYRTNKIKEIVGASQIIKESFEKFLRSIIEDEDMGLTLAEANLLQDKKDSIPLSIMLNEGDPFSLASIGDPYNCAVLYEGGGNLFMVFDSEDNCVKANKKFSRMIYERAYGLNLICAYVHVTDDFQADLKAVYQESDRVKRCTPQMHPVNVLPFTMIDRTVSLPIERRKKVKRKDLERGEFYDEEVELTRESALKLEANERAQHIEHQGQSAKDLDELTNTDSLLACIYIDGNAMGEHNKRLFDDKDDESRKQSSDYDFAASRLRENSAILEDVFQTQPVASIKKLLEKKHAAIVETSNDIKDKYWWRMIIGGGDEITIICNAYHALEVTNAYFSSVKGQKYNGTEFSSCAGIAIFHSHDPFSAVYEIAEECCESGKKQNRSVGDDQNFYIDFHYIRSGITGDLEKVRADEKKYSNRPYCWYSAANTDAERSYYSFKNAGDALREMGEDARGDIKGILEAIFRGESYYQLEIKRLKTKYKLRGRTMVEHALSEANRRPLFDACLYYDLWFAPDQKQMGDNSGDLDMRKRG